MLDLEGLAQLKNALTELKTQRQIEMLKLSPQPKYHLSQKLARKK